MLSLVGELFLLLLVAVGRRRRERELVSREGTLKQETDGVEGFLCDPAVGILLRSASLFLHFEKEVNQPNLLGQSSPCRWSLGAGAGQTPYAKGQFPQQVLHFDQRPLDRFYRSRRFESETEGGGFLAEEREEEDQVRADGEEG